MCALHLRISRRQAAARFPHHDRRRHLDGVTRALMNARRRDMHHANRLGSSTAIDTTMSLTYETKWRGSLSITAQQRWRVLTSLQEAKKSVRHGAGGWKRSTISKHHAHREEQQGRIKQKEK